MPKKLLRSMLITVALLIAGFVTQRLPAGFSSRDIKLHVIIDGTDYGPFEKIDGLDQRGSGSVTTLKLSRDFVTDPSLYYWAKDFMNSRAIGQNIEIVAFTRDGEEVKRYQLMNCQPLSWAVEATNPNIGGFHESIDIAVNEIIEQ